jgi:hypothetical protein
MKSVSIWCHCKLVLHFTTRFDVMGHNLSIRNYFRNWNSIFANLMKLFMHEDKVAHSTVLVYSSEKKVI